MVHKKLKAFNKAACCRLNKIGCLTSIKKCLFALCQTTQLVLSLSGQKKTLTIFLQKKIKLRHFKDNLFVGKPTFWIIGHAQRSFKCRQKIN
jgi:hypothetical protein